jgi:amino-acid N-acetyltransferase
MTGTSTWIKWERLRGDGRFKSLHVAAGGDFRFENACKSAILRGDMETRNARINDAKGIAALINCYAEHDKMLFRSLADIYENLQTFTVAEADGQVVGCCAVEVVWADLAELKSVAVTPARKGTGIGRALVTAAIEQARRLGISRLFALTLEPSFFQKMGFKVLEKDDLPMKVWSDCARCPKQEVCDEVAVDMILA